MFSIWTGRWNEKPQTIYLFRKAPIVIIAPFLSHRRFGLKILFFFNQFTETFYFAMGYGKSSTMPIAGCIWFPIKDCLWHIPLHEWHLECSWKSHKRYIMKWNQKNASHFIRSFDCVGSALSILFSPFSRVTCSFHLLIRSSQIESGFPPPRLLSSALRFVSSLKRR